ncbi:MAG: SDR family oxidoreductase [Pseudomonadota bacterium]
MTKTALVTGAGSGIGRSSAIALSKAGWSVALSGRREGALEETAGMCDGATLVCAGDISDADAVDGMFAAISDAWGRLDLLFNNAGRSSPPRTLDETPLEDWYGVIDANLHGSVLCARGAFAMMRAQDPQGGRIINNGSISAHTPRVGSVPYTVSKHAITGLTKSLALDGRPFKIACGQIDIGNALTEMAQKMTEGMPQPYGEIAVEAVMDPEHVAEAVVQMASYPLETNILFQTIMATNMPFVGRG